MALKQIKTSYNAGELSSYMDGREDINKYHNGCSQLINATVLPHGGFVKRGGTVYVATAANSSNLFPFEFSVDDSLILEFSNLLTRFYKDQDIVNDNAGTEDLSGVDGGALLAHWKLNEESGTNVVNADNPGTYDMTATVDVITLSATGKVGTGCFDLDGQYTCELADTDATFNFTDDSDDTAFSLACWGKVTSKGGLQVLMSKWKDQGSTREWRFSLTNDKKLQLHLADTSADFSSLVVGQWKLNDDAANTNIISSAPTYTIDDADAGNNKFIISDDGDLSALFPNSSEFTVTGSTGNDGQYTVTSTSYSSPDFTINVASVADDTDDGTISPHAGVSDDSNTEDINATGHINGALDFGGDQATVIDDSDDFSFGDGSDDSAFSIAAWIFVTNTGAFQRILSKREVTNAEEWLFTLTPTETLRFNLIDQSNLNVAQVETDNPLSLGWNFVVGTYDGTGGTSASDGLNLYVNGSLVTLVTRSTGGSYDAMENTATKVVIGASYSAASALVSFFADKLDNVILFNDELTLAQVSTLYNSGAGTEDVSSTAPIPFAISDDAVTTGWHFFVATCSTHADRTVAADDIVLYVDGAAVDSTATNDADYTAMQSGAEEIRIGSQRDSGDSANENFWQDKIDEVSVFNDVLTPTEIASLYSTTPYSIVSPYTSAEAFNIHVTQSADVMYMAHEDHHPKKLSRFDDLDWTLIDVPFTGGPFLDENTTAASLVGFARTGGTARSEYYFPVGSIGSLTASGSGNQPFNSNMVGALWLIKHTRDNDNDTDTFAKDTNVVPTLTTYASGAIFIKGDATATFEPIATGKMAQLWRKEGNGNWQTYRSFRASAAFSWTEDEDDVLYAMTRSDNTINGTLTAKNQVNRGIVKITGFTSATVVTVEVVEKVLSNNSSDAAVTTSLWAEGAWSDYRGYPRTVTFFEDRLWWASSTNNPDTIWSSKSGDYENMEFSDIGLDDDALVFPLNDNEISQIQWMFARQVMAVGAANKEYRFGATNVEDPVTPSDRKATPQTGFGSDDIQPVLLNNAIFFFQRQGKKLGAMKFDSITENFDVDDATLLAYKLFDSAPTNMAVQRVPDSLIWTVRADGVTPTFTYEPKEEVSGWARQIFGNSADVETATGFVESVAVIHGSAEDEVWVSVRRVINSSTVYYVERFKPRDWGSDIEDAFFVDSGITYDSTATSTVTAAHLKGETLAVFADGEVFDAAVADSSTGVITLKKSGNAVQASVVQYGLPYTMKVRTMRLSVPQEGNTLQTRIKRIHSVVVRYIRSLLGSAGQEYAGVEYLQDIQATYSTESQDTGENERLAQGGFSEDAYTTIISDDPVPFTVLSTVISFEVEERR